jgi:hypothetical protein
VIASIVDTGDLLQVIWVSLAVGIGVTAVYGLAIFGASRAVDLGRAGRSGEATLFGALGVAAMAAVVAAVVLGVVVLAE